MYNSAFEALNLNYAYVPFIVGDLEKAANGLRHLGIHAIGITIPYKIELMPFLDKLDEDAKRIGAVNVVVNKHGKLIGGNTDGRGAVRAIQEKTEVKGKRVLMLGGGGTARSIAFALADEGAASLTILNRTKSKAQEIADAVENGTKAGSMDQVKDFIKDTDILINTTPVGMADTETEGQSPIDANLLHSGLTILEVIGKPMDTKLVQDAKEKGCAIVYGYRMLLWQGVLKFKYYTEVEPPIEVMEEAMEKMKNS